MGTADVIPGVSGGTMALILGIYEKLIESLRGLNLRWIQPLYQFITNRDEESYNRLRDDLQSMNVTFLVILLAGILTAIIVGSFTIPPILSDYPTSIRGFFFGLILGSVWIPFTMLREHTNRSILLVLVTTVIFMLMAFFLTSPNLSVQGAERWIKVNAEQEPLGELLERNPSARAAYYVFWHPRNKSLRKQIFTERPDLEKNLKRRRQKRQSFSKTDKDAIKARSEPYEEIVIQEGMTVKIPKLSYLYVFSTAFLAISAMILPGISGSYILLILGAYFYVTFSLKGFLSHVATGTLLTGPLLTLIVFAGGLICGLLVLTRVLGYLLDHWRAPTVGALTGLMIGCLRGVWPFRMTVDGVTRNILPGTVTPSVKSGLTLMVVGSLIVILLTVVSGPSAGSVGDDVNGP